MSEQKESYNRESPWELAVGPTPDKWNDWVELDSKAWPEKKVEKHYRCVPTICFNCESACGLLAFINKETDEAEKFEGNPVHPGSRGRTCAKGPATINQINDTERILYPLKRVGPRGGGRFKPVSWEEVLDDVGSRIRKAFQEERRNEVMYHVGRPGDDHFVYRMLNAWGIDGHNSHTTVCSGAARLGYSLWMGADRPSPDYSHTKFILLLSSHLETGHYFNPHAQRIIDAKSGGSKIAVVDVRLSNTTTHADYWVSPWPGSEPALLLGIALELLTSGRFNKEYVERWVNWQDYLSAFDTDGPGTFDRFIEKLIEVYSIYTPEYVEEECQLPAETVQQLADEIAKAERQFSSHLWRNTAAGNKGGWQSARALVFLHALTGSIGHPGGVNPNSWDKAHPHPSEMPPPHSQWNELIWPREYPLSHYEMSFLLPHLVETQKKKIDTYFSRVYNPVWTNPDGCSWIEMFEKEESIGCHIALTPTWSETAQWADYVLPMGLASERHDLMSQETHAGTWIGFRQPVMREYFRQEGKTNGGEKTYDSNPGEVWEEAEFWIALSNKIDPDGSLGVREYFADKSGKPISIDDYYKDIFENVEGLAEEAAKEDLKPLEYMRKYGAYDVPYKGQDRYEEEKEGGLPMEDGTTRTGFPTLSKKLEFFSPVMKEWGYEDQCIPGYIRSHVHWRNIDLDKGQRTLLPTFRLPTLIHTRSSNAKWLKEISHTNPLWVHPEDIGKLNLKNGELARVSTDIGYFVVRVWETEGIHPGIVGCSHHMGRWRVHRDIGGEKFSTSLVDITRENGTFLFREKEGVNPFESSDSDTKKIWWKEAGVNQNLTFPVHPDPISGMHCWHQRVTVEPAREGDRYGDIFVDTNKSRAVFKEWLAETKSGPGKGGLRRPLHMNRPLKPTEDAYYIKE